jgi:FixJ family two-component response regulator
VVDGDNSVRQSLDSLIRSEGWQPETFQSAREFLRRPRPLVPSCLILNPSLPDINGLELQKPIVRERSDMPIIFLSSYGDIATTVRAMKAGAVDFLVQPFKNEVLVGVIS